MPVLPFKLAGEIWDPWIVAWSKKWMLREPRYWDKLGQGDLPSSQHLGALWFDQPTSLTSTNMNLTM
jgi:hypothetical protein